MLKKYRQQLFALIFTVFTVLISGFLVLHSENQKRLSKYFMAKDYYSGLYTDWETYKAAYTKAIQDQKEKNTKAMLEAKVQYEDLLQRQPQLVAQNTKIQKVVTYTQAGASTVVVQKPKSTPSTKAS